MSKLRVWAGGGQVFGCLALLGLAFLLPATQAQEAAARVCARAMEVAGACWPIVEDRLLAVAALAASGGAPLMLLMGVGALVLYRVCIAYLRFERLEGLQRSVDAAIFREFATTGAQTSADPRVVSLTYSADPVVRLATAVLLRRLTAHEARAVLECVIEDHLGIVAYCERAAGITVALLAYNKIGALLMAISSGDSLRIGPALGAYGERVAVLAGFFGVSLVAMGALDWLQALARGHASRLDSLLEAIGKGEPR